MEYLVQVQIRDIKGKIVLKKQIEKGYSWELMDETTNAIFEEIGSGPQKGSMTFIVNGRAVRVQSVNDILGNKGRHTNGSAGYSVNMAQHVLELRKEPGYQLIPPVLHFQKLYFGADSDEANIAIACMLDRLSFEISADKHAKTGNLQTWEQQSAHFWENFYELDEIYGEIGDSNIRDQISEEFERQRDRYNKLYA